jgi:predicted dehydrogenase
MKIGIVGHGSIGRRHAENARKLGHQTLIYDPATSESDVGREAHVYDQADAVVIATPSYCHEAGLRACVERGKHVLIEKPISLSYGQLEMLLSRAEEKALVVMMGNNLRFHPCVQQAKRWLSAGMIGIVHWAQFTCATMSVKPLYLSDGVILNTGSHEVDLAMHLLGDVVVQKADARLSGPHDEMAEFLLGHHNGAWSSFHLDFITQPTVRDFRIVGSDGQIWCNLEKRVVVRTQPDDKLPGIEHVDKYDGPGAWDDDYLAEMRAFVGKIQGHGSPFGATGRDGLDVLEVLLAVRKEAGL